MFDQFTPGHTRPARRPAKLEDVAGAIAAALFLGGGLLLITSALHEAEQQAPPSLSVEAMLPACEPIAGARTLDPIPPRIAELCANYF
jgi:hypothetical protein